MFLTKKFAKWRDFSGFLLENSYLCSRNHQKIGQK